MADEQAGAKPADGGATPPPAGAPAAAPATGAAEDAIGEGGKAAIAKERAARATAEAEAKAANAELQKIRDAQLSEQEKATKRAEASEQARIKAEGELRDLTVRSAVMTSAAAANFLNPDLAARLIAVADVEMEADGRSPKSVERLVADLAKQYPYLVRTGGSFDQGARTNGAAGAPIFTRSQIRDQAFYKANEAAIMAAYRDGRIKDDINS